MEKILIDSDIWIGLFHIQDSQHMHAQTCINRILEQKAEIVTHESIIGETLTVIKLRKVKELSKIVQDFFAGKFAEITMTPFSISQELCDIFTNDTTDLSIIDTFILLLCRDQHYTLATFDDNLKEVARNMGVSVLEIT